MTDDLIERIATEEDLWEVGSRFYSNAPSEWIVYRGEQPIEKHECPAAAKLALRRLRAECVLSIARAELEWQPIETAPKDMSIILIKEGRMISTVVWRDIYDTWVVPTDEGWVRCTWINPTHWRKA